MSENRVSIVKGGLERMITFEKLIENINQEIAWAREDIEDEKAQKNIYKKSMRDVPLYSKTWHDYKAQIQKIDEIIRNRKADIEMLKGLLEG